MPLAPSMRLHYSEKFRRDYEGAPLEIQRTFDRKAELLVTNLRHPSLRAKKYSEASDVWQARVTQGWRLYFKIEGDTYYLISFTSHPNLPYSDTGRPRSPMPQTTS